MKKVYLEVYGCSSNQGDYEIALGLLKKANYKITNEKESDINIIFTCSVKIPTINKILHRIKEFTKTKKPLIVAGCLPLTRKKLIEKINKNASLVSPDNVDKIVKVVKKALNGKRVELLSERKKPKINLPRCRKNSLVGIVHIGRGCLSNCSYCNEPYKGKLFSYPIEEIVKEVKNALEDGCKEIWLTSLDTGCYGFDINTNLNELLEKICRIEKKFFVRIGMMNPKYLKIIGKGLMKVIENEKIFKFLHLPLQSGSNKVLKIMNRGYRVEDFVRYVKKIRKKFPYLTLSTDLIVGHPGENEKDFKKSLKVVKEIEADIVNISKFGMHPKTLAAKMEKISDEEIKRRSRILSQLVKEVSLKRNKKWIGWKGEALIDEVGKNNTLVARNFAYKPIVLRANKKFFGNFVEVEIKNVKETYLIGKIVTNL
jgi:MiaB-like tRNA modifying enzyme